MRLGRFLINSKKKEKPDMENVGLSKKRAVWAGCVGMSSRNFLGLLK